MSAVTHIHGVCLRECVFLHIYSKATYRCKISVYVCMRSILCGCVCVHHGAHVCGNGSLSLGQCVWLGPLVCGQKTERLLSGAITALTVRRHTVENMALWERGLQKDISLPIAKVNKHHKPKAAGSFVFYTAVLFRLVWLAIVSLLVGFLCN